MTTPAVHTLHNDHLRLDVTPDTGAGIVNLHARVQGEWTPILRPTSTGKLAGGRASDLASFTLAPYSNRIPGATFQYRGRRYALRPTTPEGNAQHGDVRGRPHRTRSVTPARAEYHLDSRDFPDFNWPWHVTLDTTYELHGNTLVQTLRLTNVGDEPCPAGLGLHPYFVRTLPGSGDVRLHFQTHGYYPTDETHVPTGPAQPIPPELDFTREREVGATQLNTGYAGLSGAVTLTYPGTGVQVRLHADPIYSHLIAYTAPDGTLAVEPITHATDAINLHARGVPGAGYRELSPGDSLGGAVRTQVVSAPVGATGTPLG